ncbi:hypothetical protein ACRAWD_01040 [Caulobacter segnis]
MREPHDSDFDHASLTLAGDGDWGRVTGAVSRLSHNFGSRYDATAASALYDLAGVPAAFDEHKAINLTVVEVTYATPSEYRLRGLVGAFASDGSIGLASNLHALPAHSPGVYAERRRDEINRGGSLWRIDLRRHRASVGHGWPALVRLQLRRRPRP